MYYHNYIHKYCCDPISKYEENVINQEQLVLKVIAGQFVLKELLWKNVD